MYCQSVFSIKSHEQQCDFQEWLRDNVNPGTLWWYNSGLPLYAVINFRNAGDAILTALKFSDGLITSEINPTIGHESGFISEVNCKVIDNSGIKFFDRLGTNLSKMALMMVPISDLT